MKKLRVFAASTSDTAAERAKVEKAAEALKPLADYLGLVLDVSDWRAAVPDLGRPQQVIFDQLKPTEWDVFIGILWHRFGTPPGAADPQTRRDYLSGTEEEFKTVYRLWEQRRRPRVMMYRCTRPIPQDALDPDQFKRVKDFFAQFEAVGGEHPGLHQTFDTIESFEKLLLDNLQRLLLDYGEQAEGKPVAPEVVQSLAPRTPDNLPRRASFFGRDKDMEVVLRALGPEDRTWGILLDGIGGIGKTALAVEAAHRCKETGLFDAFVFVSAKQTLLAPGGIRELPPVARTLDEFLNETARVLAQTGIPQLTGDAKRRALLDALRGTPTLLVYDNLETLSKEEQEAVADFLRELPQGCKAVITSRRRGGEGAVWHRLEKLDWDAARQLIAEEARKASGLNAKLQRATEARWPELYDATGGSPLALSHTLGLMRVRAALSFDRALEMLRGNPDADLQDFIFREARCELTTNDETALRALSFFVPSATFESWAEVAQLSRTALETTIDRLSALSLIDALTGEERYALHPLTRNFVRDELLADAQTARKIGMHFANYWVAYANRHGRTRRNYKTFGLLEAEWPNLRASAAWLWQEATVPVSVARDKDAARILNNLVSALCAPSGPLFYADRWDEKAELSGLAYESALAIEDWDDACRRAYEVATIHYQRAGIDEAARWADRCAEASAHSSDKQTQPLTLNIRAKVATELENYDEAERLYQTCLALCRDSGWDWDTMVSLINLGKLECERENYAAAEIYFNDALELNKKVESNEADSLLCCRFGLLNLERGRRAEARERFEKGLLLAHEVGRQDLISWAQYGLARMYEEEGRPDLALPLAQEAATTSERLRDRDSPDMRRLVERLKATIGGG